MEHAMLQEHHLCSDDVNQGAAARGAVTDLGFSQISLHVLCASPYLEERQKPPLVSLPSCWVAPDTAAFAAVFQSVVKYHFMLTRCLELEGATLTHIFRYHFLCLY